MRLTIIFCFFSPCPTYESARKIRVSVIHGLARMAAIMASTYKAYLGVGLGPLSFLTKFRIPHPGRVGGRFFIDIGMRLMLSWVLGGYGFLELFSNDEIQALKSDKDWDTESSAIVGVSNTRSLEGRSPQCRLSDKASNQLKRWFKDDDALERALNGEWFLFPVGNESSSSKSIFLSRNEGNPCIIGVPRTNIPGISVVIPSPQVSELHARISSEDGAFFLTDLRSEHGTWITDNEGRRYRVSPNFPARFHPSDVIEFGSDKKAAFRVKVMKIPLKTTYIEIGRE